MMVSGDRFAQAVEPVPHRVADSSWLMPSAQVHPLPEFLAQWRDPHQSGDYFEEISPTSAGYLIWSRFPIQVFIESAVLPEGSTSQLSRSALSNPALQRWNEAVVRGVDAWSAYLPIQYAATASDADIQIWASAPPLRYAPTGELERARAAETRYELYLGSDTTLENRESESPQLLPRCEIWLSPRQSDEHIAATARHEMGHALGIWGHSPTASDALYFAQVRSPQPISSRDINTLQKIYEQPTQIGWPWISQPEPHVPESHVIDE